MHNRKFTVYVIFLIAAVLLTILISFLIGNYKITLTDFFNTVINKVTGKASTNKIKDTIIFSVRFPRIIMSLFVGMGLSVAGISMQGIFKNPLVSPHILGVSAGAGFGAALGILLFNSFVYVQLSAFVFGIISVGLTCFLGTRNKSGEVYSMVLSGIIVGAFFSALLSLLKYVADPEAELPSIVFWIMGSFSGTGVRELTIGLPVIIVSTFVLFSFRWKLNILSLSEEEAHSMGLKVKKDRAIIIIFSTLITAVAVGVCGIISWVGLVIPHLSRMLVGVDNRKSMVVAALTGGVYLMIIDNISRSITESEIPLSILTAIIGAPFFAYLLGKKRVV